MENTIQLLFFILVIIPSAILHEWAHGFAADKLGDPTPRLAGRLTINPIPHIDIWGTLLLPFLLFFLTSGSFLFAYAKPVPFNPLALRLRRWGPAVVGLAGPAANLVLAFGLGLFVRFMDPSTFTVFLSIVVYANVLLAVFNLVPIPPLDGSHVLFSFLPDSLYSFKVWLQRFGFIILIFFLLFLFDWLQPIMAWLYYLAAGQFLL
ncbi:MAG: site-2 protease family protein [Candidatus Veblenbacteria bacterium]|nr:site-2 protease family protein [Candidatus Veblenbacteria bacterium]